MTHSNHWKRSGLITLAGRCWRKLPKNDRRFPAVPLTSSRYTNMVSNVYTVGDHVSATMVYSALIA